MSEDQRQLLNILGNFAAILNVGLLIVLMFRMSDLLKESKGLYVRRRK